MPRIDPTAALLVALTSLFAAGSASGQEIKWRDDYAAARKEATETGRPLLLDFGTDACFWCKKLDATTFRDPKVVKLLNEGFVPVKLDGNKHPRLVEALKIDGFPTLILASPEGKVLGRHAGYADVGQLTALLGRAPAVHSPKPISEPQKQWMSAAEIDAALAALLPKIVARLER